MKPLEKPTVDESRVCTCIRSMVSVNEEKEPGCTRCLGGTVTEDEKGNIYANYCNNLSEDGYKNIYVREEDAEKARERLREAEEADRRWSKTDKPSCIL